MNTMPTVLVVDDDPEIVRLLKAYLEQDGYRVDVAYNGETALRHIIQHPPSLLILDLMLPDRDGWNITSTVRANAQLTGLPIIMLTARIQDADKILGLELGADDYITKPFNPREVVARARAVLRRTNPTPAPVHPVLEYRGLKMDIEQRLVTVNGQAVELTPTEFDLLRTLMENPGYVFTRSTLIERSLGYDYQSLERTIDSHIRNLRRKIEPDPRVPIYVQTIHGVGYRFERLST
jgi:DNA-binding response OmpR family regulator